MKAFDSCPWLMHALGELGVSELDGLDANPRILEYLATCNFSTTEDETPWCAAFINWCLKRAGVVGTNRPNAKSYLDWGVKCDPRVGAIAVMDRGKELWMGHVEFVLQVNKAGTLFAIGGNQGNAVTINTLLPANVLSFRYSKEYLI